MKIVAIFFITVSVVFSLLLFTAVNPPKAEAVPSYARQTGLPCSGCHYTPPELNPAGRRFKLTGYVDRADETKVVKADGGKKRAPLDLLSTLATFGDGSRPRSHQQKLRFPERRMARSNCPRIFLFFISGAWTSHVGSFMQVTYDTQDDHFSMDNTDIRYANTTKWGGKEFVYGLNVNNNPTVEDLWNSTPAWGFPFVADDWAPTPACGSDRHVFRSGRRRVRRLHDVEQPPLCGCHVVPLRPYWRLTAYGRS